MPILAIVDDLLFRAKLEASATHLGTALTVASAERALGVFQQDQSWQLVILDLNVSSRDPLTLIRAMREVAPTMPIIGYCAHVQRELPAQAMSAGCTTVLPHSALVQRLPELLSGVVP